MAQTTYSELRTIGFAGMLADSNDNVVITMRNDETTAEMAFGYAVKYDSVTDEHSAKLLTAITGEVVPGILLHSHSYADTALGDDGVKPDEKLNILVRGRVLVVCEDGCDVGERLHIRAVATGAEIEGALLAAADGSDTIASTGQGVWRTSAAAGALAWLEVDFTNPLT